MLSQFSFMTVSLQTIHIWIMFDRKSWFIVTPMLLLLMMILLILLLLSLNKQSIETGCQHITPYQV